MKIDLRNYDVLSGREVLSLGGTMHVLQIAASVAARDGGPSTAIVNINRHLRAQGSNSMILTTDADGRHGRLDVDTKSPTDLATAVVVYCRRSWPYTLKNSWTLGWRTWKIGRTADIMHVHGVYLANSVWAYVTSKLSSTPYVLQPHGTLEPYQQVVNAGRKRLFNALIGNRIVRSASCIISASESEAQNIRGQYPDARIEVVPLGYSAHEPIMPKDSSEILQRWQTAPKHERVIFLGRLARKKRPDLLARAWRDMPGMAQLIYIGPPQDWSEESLRYRLEIHSDESVHFLPAVDAQGVAWCLSEAGIFVLPSENENFGLAVIEAMAGGCAILSTTATAATEHVLKAAAGIVVDKVDENILRNQLLQLLDDEATVTSMGKRGADYVAKNLTWQSTTTALQTIYSGEFDRRKKRSLRIK